MALFDWLRRRRLSAGEERHGETPAEPAVEAEVEFDADAEMQFLRDCPYPDDVLRRLDRCLEELQEAGHGAAVATLVEQLDRDLERGMGPDRMAQLGSLYQRLDGLALAPRCRRALALYEEALAGYREAGEREGTAILLNNMGLAHIELGETDGESFRRAVPLLEEALQFFEEGEDLTARGAICMSLGEAYTGLQEAGADHLELALEYYERAGALAERVGDAHSQAAAQGHMGDAQVELAVYYGPQTLEKGIRHYRNALGYFTDSGDLVACGRYQRRLGDAYLRMGDGEEEHLREGLRAYERALEMLRQGGDRLEVALVGSRCARLYLRGDPDEEELRMAMDLYLEALPILDENGREAERGEVLLGLARIYLSQGEAAKEGDIAQGVRLLEEALEIAARVDSPERYRSIRDLLRQARLMLQGSQDRESGERA